MRNKMIVATMVLLMSSHYVAATPSREFARAEEGVEEQSYWLNGNGKTVVAVAVASTAAYILGKKGRNKGCDKGNARWSAYSVMNGFQPWVGEKFVEAVCYSEDPLKILRDALRKDKTLATDRFGEDNNTLLHIIATQSSKLHVDDPKQKIFTNMCACVMEQTGDKSFAMVKNSRGKTPFDIVRAQQGGGAPSTLVRILRYDKHQITLAEWKQRCGVVRPYSASDSAAADHSQQQEGPPFAGAGAGAGAWRGGVQQQGQDDAGAGFQGGGGQGGVGGGGGGAAWQQQGGQLGDGWDGQ